METRSIDLVQLFKYSYQQFRKYASFVIGAMLTLFVLAYVPQVYFTLNAPQEPTTQSQFLSLILMLVQAFLTLGFTKLMLLLVQDKFVEVADMFNNFKIFLSYFVASFLYGIGVVLGTLLLVVPGIFIAIRFQFYPHFIIEEEVSSLTALQKSYNLSQNLTLELFLLGIVVIALNAVGILLLGVGFIITYPLSSMATAVVFKGIADEADKIPTDGYIA